MNISGSNKEVIDKLNEIDTKISKPSTDILYNFVSYSVSTSLLKVTNGRYINLSTYLSENSGIFTALKNFSLNINIGCASQTIGVVFNIIKNNVSVKSYTIQSGAENYSLELSEGDTFEITYTASGTVSGIRSFDIILYV